MALPNIKKLFIPDPGMTMFDIDLNAADLRIVVWESGCERMKQWFREGKDPYTEVARNYYQDPDITKKDPRRQLFKSFCHGSNYLGLAKNLAPKVGLTPEKATATQEWYFAQFPEIKEWQIKFKERVRKTATVENVFGYKRRIFDRIEGNIFNELIAWIPQSTVAILINKGWVNIEKTLPDVDILLQVHDSLAGQYPTDKPERADDIVKAASIVLPYADPMVIPVGIKTSPLSWGDCK